MKAPDFSYVRPQTLAQAVALLDEHGERAAILAGGQGLMASLNFRLAAPDVLIDINRIEAGAARIEDRGDVLRFGPLVRHADIEASELVREKIPLMAHAVPHIAHPAIRNRGTLAGSLAYSDPAAEWPAVCVALGAVIGLVSSKGERTLRAKDFFLGMFETARGSDEIIAFVDVPVQRAGEKVAFRELARRHGDFALAGVCIQKETVGNLRIVFFGAHSHPVLAINAAGAIKSGASGNELIAAIGKDISPLGDIHASASQRLHLAGVLLQRAMKDIDAESHP